LQKLPLAELAAIFSQTAASLQVQNSIKGISDFEQTKGQFSDGGEKVAFNLGIDGFGDGTVAGAV